jgi:drug/metabolite transporter (DMT)-like permease
VIYGLLTALGWGASDLLASIVTRKIGSRITVVVAQIAGFAALLVVELVLRPSWGMPVHDVLLLLGSGCIAGVGYFALYRGLQLGPIALVSPIASAFAVVTILLSVAALGEKLGAGEWVGVACTILGVVLASTDLRRLEKAVIAHRRGIPLALAAMAGFGVAAFVTGSFAKTYGWLPPVVVARIGSLALIAVVTLATTRGRDRERPSSARLGPWMVVAIVVGLADVVGIAFFARGSELGFISIVVAASSTFTLLPVAGGIALFGERPAPNQALGVALVIIGLVLLGLSA